MPQRLSQFKNSSKLVTSDINVYISDYGTIDTNSTHTAAVNNGLIFQKAFNDVYNMKFSPWGATTCTIWCPPGDYYFGDSEDLALTDYYPIDFNHPQSANITVRSTVDLDWSLRPSNSSISSASTVTARYTLLAGFYQTRFHFTRNGVNGRNVQTYGRIYPNDTSSGFKNIGFFGRYNGSPGTFNGSSDFYTRGVIGSLEFENCCFHGFGAITANPGFSYVTASDGWGIGTVNGGAIEATNVQLVDCMRGIVAESGGSVSTFGDCSIIHSKESGIVAADNGVVYFAGEGAGYISNSTNIGAHAFSAGVIRFGYGGTAGTFTHTVASSGYRSLRVDTLGLITGESGRVSYSNQEVLGNGIILFR
jgi:hypothetical protein